MISFCFDFYNFYSVFSKLISFGATESSCPGAEQAESVWTRESEQSGLFVSQCRIFSFLQSKNYFKIYQELDTTDLRILKKYLELIIAGKF